MKYTNGFLSAEISDSKSLVKIGKEVEKGNANFHHYAMDRCYYKATNDYTRITDKSELDKAIEKQKEFINKH